MLKTISYFIVNVLIYITADKCIWEIKMKMDADFLLLLLIDFMSVLTISYFSRLKDT